MRCPKCEAGNLPDSAFCVECGAKLENACPTCGADNPDGAKFCRKCGVNLVAFGRMPSAYTPPHLADKILAAKAFVEGERKQVTVLFADVKGSMDLQEQLDPEAWRDLMDRFFHLMCEGVHRFEGTVNKFTGDGIMALFGAPIAHEDHPQRACYAALQIQKELGSYARDLRRDHGLSFSVRMGINSGDVVLGTIGDDLRVDYTALGHTVGLASRVEGIAEPGKVYVTEHTADLVTGFFDLEDLGPFAIKGAREPVRVFELRGLGSMRTRLDVARARGFSRFVGRHEEQRVIEEAFARALEGHGQVVGVVGEAGLGKSRLCYEFAEACRGRGISVREARGVAHGKSVPYLPVLEMLRDFFGITDQDTDQHAREKIAGRLVLLDKAFEDGLPLLFDFLGVPDPERPAPRMGAEARQRQLLGMVKRIVQARSAREPAVLVFEDLHWIDPGSQGFLDAIIDALPGTRTLAVANFRPEYHAPWMQKTYYRGLPLQPLGSDAMREMLLDLLGSDPSLNGLADLIVERTAGNPFFIEETVHQLVESGSLQGKRGAYRLTHPVAHVAIPPTVEAVLASRIDRLGEREKALLQTASVIGREVPLAVLGRVADLPESDLAYALDELVRAEFLYEAALYPETEYAFRHPLIQDVAYRSQLAERRSRVHRAVAQSILALAPDKAQERAALLAHHWEGAGEPLEASRWHLTASAWVGRSDHAQALHHLRTGRSLLESAPSSGDAEGLLLGVLGQILYHGWRIGLPAEEATDVYSRARSLAERAGDPTTLVVIIATYAAVRALSGEIADALALSREAWEIFGKGPGHPGLALTMRVNLSYLMFILGDWPESMAILEEGVAVNPEDPTLGADLIGFSPWIWMSAVRGLLNAYMGRPERTLEMIDAALDVARRHGDMEIEGWLHGMYAAYARMTGDLEALGAHGRQAVAIAEKIGSAFSRALAYENLGQSYSVRGEWADAVAALEQALGIMRGHGVGIEQSPFVLWMLAEAYLESEDDRALQTAEEAVAEAQRLGTKALEVEALRVLARALVRERGAEAAGRARDSLERALALVKVTGGVAAEPDVRLALAELAAATGDDAARMRQLREAQRILTRMGATVRAERVATLLS